MKLKLSKSIFAISLLTASLISTSAMAAPKLLFKDVKDSGHALKTASMPDAISGVVKKIMAKNPSLHQIVVYKNQNHYLLYLLSGTTWEASKVKVDLDGAGKLNGVVDNYQGGLKELLAETGDRAIASNDQVTCPDTSVEFLAISAYPGVAAVDDSMATASEAAKKKFKTMTIVSEDADAQTYKNWLSCPNLKGVFSIGHGSPEGMMVGNGDMLSYDFFGSKEMKNKFKSTTVVFNACQVYNYPIGTEVMYGNVLTSSDFSRNPGPNTYEYIGGHTNLLMYSSERSAACFLAKAFDGAKMDYDTMKQCVGSQNFHFQNFGISHPGKLFGAQV